MKGGPGPGLRLRAYSATAAPGGDPHVRTRTIMMTLPVTAAEPWTLSFTRFPPFYGVGRSWRLEHTITPRGICQWPELPHLKSRRK